MGYHRDATSTLAETPGAGNPSAEATPSQVQGVLNPGGGLARQAAGVAKAGPVVISSGPESDTAAVVDEGPSAGSASDRKSLESFYREWRWAERQTPFPKSRPIVLPGGAISCLGRIDINYNSDVSWDSEAAKVAANRFFGAIRAGWAAAGGVGSVMLLVAPEPTGATKVAGAATLMFCVDEMIAGVRAAATGEYSDNFKTQGIAATGQKVLGLTEEESLPIARGIDGVVNLGVSLLPRGLEILKARAAASTAEQAAKTTVSIAAPASTEAKVVESSTTLAAPKAVPGPSHNASRAAGLAEDLRAGELANPLIDSLRGTGQLPSNYVTKAQATALGWQTGKALHNKVPGGQIGGDVFRDPASIGLPTAPGRVWYEADIGLNNTMSRAK